MRCAILFGLFACGLTACGDSHEAMVEEMVRLMEERSAVIDKVDSAASAADAVVKLKAIAQKVKDLSDRARALGDAPADFQEHLQANHFERLKAILAQDKRNAIKLKTYPELIPALVGLPESAPR